MNVNDVNYHRSSHGAASYALSGKNDNAMLEYIKVPFVHCGSLQFYKGE